jgi:catechol 2,3-dioxygenase-like lactoylglutathione lyase family enzyme
VVLRNPDHVTIAVADAARAIEFFALLGFRTERVATIDDGAPARYLGMPEMKAQHITLALAGCEPRFEAGASGSSRAPKASLSSSCSGSSRAERCGDRLL